MGKYQITCINPNGESGGGGNEPTVTLYKRLPLNSWSFTTQDADFVESVGEKTVERCVALVSLIASFLNGKGYKFEKTQELANGVSYTFTYLDRHKLILTNDATITADGSSSGGGTGVHMHQIFDGAAIKQGYDFAKHSTIRLYATKGGVFNTGTDMAHPLIQKFSQGEYGTNWSGAADGNYLVYHSSFQGYPINAKLVDSKSDDKCNALVSHLAYSHSAYGSCGIYSEYMNQLLLPKHVSTITRGKIIAIEDIKYLVVEYGSYGAFVLAELPQEV